MQFIHACTIYALFSIHEATDAVGKPGARRPTCTLSSIKGEKKQNHVMGKGKWQVGCEN